MNFIIVHFSVFSVRVLYDLYIMLHLCVINNNIKIIMTMNTQNSRTVLCTYCSLSILKFSDISEGWNAPLSNFSTGMHC